MTKGRKTTQQIAALDRLAREIQVRPIGRKVAVVPPSPDEQPLFLNMLRGFADNSRVQLAKYDNRTVPPPASGSADAKTNLLPPGVIALTSNVEIAGRIQRRTAVYVRFVALAAIVQYDGPALDHHG